MNDSTHLQSVPRLSAGKPSGRERLRVVVIDEELPYPTNSGKRLRTLNLLQRLAGQHDITYLAHRNADAGEAEQASEHLQSRGIQTIIVPRSVPPKSGWRFYRRLAINLLSPLPYSVSSHTSPELRSEIRKLEASGQVDLWHCEWTPYLENLRTITRQPIVSVAHNIESRIWQRYFESELNAAKRWYIGQQWRKFASFERWAFSHATRTVFVSELDAGTARNEYGAERTAVVENGVDTQLFRPQFEKRNPFELLILGSLDWRPNIDGVNRFLNQVFPCLLQGEPRFHLTIVGRNPEAQWARRLQDTANVNLHANVADVRPFVASAGALVVPLRIGGGSRLKILEAAASGLPVISTLLGAEGLALDPLKHYFAAGDIESMAFAIVEAAANPGEMQSRARAACAVVQEQYDWNSIAGKMKTVWNEAGKLAAAGRLSPCDANGLSLLQSGNLA